MRSTTRLLTLVSTVLGLVAAPVLAAPHGGATKPGMTVHGQKVTTSAASAPKGPTMKTTSKASPSMQGTKAQGSSAKGTTMKSTHASGPKNGGSTSGTTTHTTTSSGKSAKTGKTSTTGTTTPTATSPGTSTSPGKPAETPGAGSPTGTWTPDNPIAQKLSTKANLLNRVQRSLPPGTDLNAATAGFKNFGQFVAAVNVSNNLGIPFADLKASMTGLKMDGTSTGKPTASLGQSIQQLKPGVNAEMEAQKAETEATSLITEKSPTTGTTGTTPSKKKSTSHPGTSTHGGSV